MRHPSVLDKTCECPPQQHIQNKQMQKPNSQTSKLKNDKQRPHISGALTANAVRI